METTHIHLKRNPFQGSPLFFYFLTERLDMQREKLQKHFQVVVVLESGMKKTVDVKASNQEVAERRALKRSGGVSIWKR